MGFFLMVLATIDDYGLDPLRFASAVFYFYHFFSFISHDSFKTIITFPLPHQLFCCSEIQCTQERQLISPNWNTNCLNLGEFIPTFPTTGWGSCSRKWSFLQSAMLFPMWLFENHLPPVDSPFIRSLSHLVGNLCKGNPWHYLWQTVWVGTRGAGRMTLLSPLILLISFSFLPGSFTLWGSRSNMWLHLVHFCFARFSLCISWYIC